MKRIYLPIVAAFAALTITSCGGQQVANDGTGRETVEMSGAGATFPLPFYTMTFESYSEKIGDKVSYGGIGSGGGIRNLKDEIVDFAGTDAFLTDEEMKEMNPVVHVPTCMGAVVIAYNLPGSERAESFRRGHCRHLLRQNLEVGRPAPERTEPAGRAARQGHHTGLPL